MVNRPIAGPFAWRRARPSDGGDEDLVLDAPTRMEFARVYQRGAGVTEAASPYPTARLLAASWDMFIALRTIWILDIRAVSSQTRARQLVAAALNSATEDWRSMENPNAAIAREPVAEPTVPAVAVPVRLSALEREIIDAIVARRQHQRGADDFADGASESLITLADRLIDQRDAAAKTARAEQRAILLDIGTRLGTALRAAGAVEVADQLVAFASRKLDEIAEPEPVTGRGIS